MYTSTCNCECIFHVIRLARLLHYHLNVHNFICSVSFSSLLVNWKPQVSLYCELDFNKQKKKKKKKKKECSTFTRHCWSQFLQLSYPISHRCAAIWCHSITSKISWNSNIYFWPIWDPQNLNWRRFVRIDLVCHSFIICFLCEFYVFELSSYMGHHWCRPPIIMGEDGVLPRSRRVPYEAACSAVQITTEPCMSTSTRERSANIWSNILRLRMHEAICFTNLT